MKFINNLLFGLCASAFGMAIIAGMLIGANYYYIFAHGLLGTAPGKNVIVDFLILSTGGIIIITATIATALQFLDEEK